jgi:hypothetical protein
MHDYLFVGTAIGLLFGLMHTAYLAKLVASGSNAGAATNWIAVLNFSAWALLLWFLMGAYVVGFWLVGFVFWLIFKAFR